MTEEIKEILDEMLWQFEKYPTDDFIVKNKESRILLNYITNLQKENEDLRESNHNWQRKLSDYKQRNEKAIDELFELKNMIYKPETREENFEIQRKISSIIKKLGLGGDE